MSSFDIPEKVEGRNGIPTVKLLLAIPVLLGLSRKSDCRVKGEENIPNA